ncbi:hypothetical protein DUI87_05258 [Hirundo rustica rustica]|uniref:Dynein regulatory complex subunit 3 n=1 Tax=Hirundo rustica rustica TaxID=333673 RepID=A0A3M0L1C9_HIRRU|nr:hypothetical protein DUI87_05258 [Hirundo rustica rustica]
MSQFFSNVEPNIIDDAMVQKATEEKCPEDLGDLARQENTNVKVVTELQLSFKSILQIDNLWQLENLTKLQLDNNFIEKIEGLESLVHLVWLDLSFNNIEVIEGLDTLVRLQDLSLYSNRISKIEHMDTLQELQIFSVGKNNLTVLEDRQAAAVKYQDLTKPLEQEEAQVLALQEIEEAEQKELEYQQTAFVEYLNGSLLFDSLYAEDREAAILASLPAVEDLLQAYPSWVWNTYSGKKEFLSVTEKLYNYGLEEYEKRAAEVSKFYKRFYEILTANQQESKRIISDFESRNQRRLDELYQAGSGDIAESEQTQGKEDIHQLWDALMTLETLVSNDLECRDLENEHHEKLMEIVIATLEKLQEEEFEEDLQDDLPDDVRRLLVDKNTIVNAINVSHRIRLQKVDKRESDMLCNIYKWQISVIEKAFQTESDRNRACIKKIICLINTLKKELGNSDPVILEPME